MMRRSDLEVGEVHLTSTAYSYEQTKQRPLYFAIGTIHLSWPLTQLPLLPLTFP